MKNILVFCALLCVFLSCNNQTNTTETKQEQAEMEKVESMGKTDKQKEDSVLAKWQSKMNETKSE